MSASDAAMLVDLYLSGMSIPDVSAETGLSRSTVRYHLKAANALRSRADAVRLAGKSGKLGGGLRGKRRVFSEEHCRKISESKRMRGELSSAGISIKPSGYVEITRGANKGRSQHRVVMEELIGRPLRKDEHVHHIDENRSNNDISNLLLMTKSQHMSHHAKQKTETRERNENGTWR